MERFSNRSFLIRRFGLWLRRRRAGAPAPILAVPTNPSFDLDFNGKDTRSTPPEKMEGMDYAVLRNTMLKPEMTRVEVRRLVRGYHRI